MKILFLVSHPIEGAAPRYRVYQYMPYLEKRGIQYKIRPFISTKFYKILYSEKKRINKFLYFIICSCNRLLDIFRALEYDIIFIQRDTYPIGPPVIEFILSKILLKMVIYDFDDAIFIQETETNPIITFLKNPGKINKIISWSDYVIAGNNYLKDYALQFNNKSYTIPTSIETNKFKPIPKKMDKIIIGWIGSYSTAKYLAMVYSALQKLAEKYEFELYITGAGRNISIPGVNITNKKWCLDREVEDFQELTIGIYPLPQDKWALGKCGFKAIQYMAMGIPTVASPVGVNCEIIKDGINGFLAKTEEEWFGKLSALIENKELRDKFSIAGRETIERHYSTSKVFSNLFSIIDRMNKINMMQLISDLDIGGTEKMLVELVNGIDKSKYNITICSVTPAGPIADDIKKIKDISVLSLDIISKLNFLAFFKLFYLIKKYKINIVQSYLFFDNFLNSIVSNIAGVPVIIGGHRAVERNKMIWKNILQSGSNKLMDRIIANSYAGKADLISNLKVPSNKIMVIHNGKTIAYYDEPQENFFEFARLGIDQEKHIIIGMIGRMHEQKGHKYLLQAAALIRDPKIKFILVGSGKLINKMKQLRDALQLRNTVFFLGEIKDIRPILKCFDIFVLPSLWEGLPGVIIEAMIMNKPVIATAVDGSKELVIDNKTGVLVQPKDPHALAEKIIELANNKKLRVKMGEAGRKRAEAYFTSERMVLEYEKTYDELWNRKIVHYKS